jgi:hypothetical protein
MDVLDLMRLGCDARFPVKLRGFEVSLRPLTIAETVQLAGEVGEELAKKPNIARNAITEHVIFSIKTLTMASTSAPEKGDQKLTEYVLQSLTPDELHYLFKEYCIGNDRLNPSLEKLSMDNLNELVALVKKNHSALIELSFLELVNLSRHLLECSPTDK